MFSHAFSLPLLLALFTIASCKTVITLPPPPSKCAVILCKTGTRCIETPTGAKCVPFPCACPLLLAPVCCRSPTGVLSTKGNECLCSGCSAGGTVVSKGPCPPKRTCATVRCKKGFKCVETAKGPKCVKINPCICTLQYDPVCCKSKTGKLTKESNACFCTSCKSGSSIFSKGECPSCKTVKCPPGKRCKETKKGPKCVKIRTCICTREFRPVCCKKRNGKIITTSNSCLCTKCRKGTVLHTGKCRATPCICPAIFAPVCCSVKGKPVFTAGNDCQCRCQKGKVVASGACKLVGLHK